MNNFVKPPQTVDAAEVEADEEEVTGQDTETSVPTVVPTAEQLKEICADIKLNYNYKVNVKPTTFNFKTKKDKDTGVEFKRDSLELPIPYPSPEGIVDILETGGQGLDLLIEAMETVVNAQARNLISDDLTINATNLPIDKLSWDFISKIPKTERTGGGIAKEVWEAFAADYVAVMMVAASKSEKAATLAGNILKKKLADVKTNKPVLTMLVGQLAIYAEHSQRITEFANCVEFLVNKANDLLKVTDEELLSAL